MNRLDRLTAILIQLQSQRVVKAQSLAERFGISERTVYRDIRSLEAAGIPIGSEPGLGYFLAPGYHLPPVMFTREEASALLLGSKLAAKLADPSIQQTFDAALYKIKSIVKDPLKDHLQALSTYIEVFAPPKAPEQPALLAELQHLLVQQAVLEIDYYSAYNQQQTQRIIEPIGIYHYGLGWHLVAYCRLRQAYREFRVDRIQQLKVLPAKRSGEVRQTLQAYLEQLSHNRQLHQAVVHFKPEVVRFIGERKYFYGFVSEHTTVSGTTMTFFTSELHYFGRWLLTYTNAITIIEPPALQQIMRELTTELLQHFHS